jgi:hypothetical protein
MINRTLPPGAHYAAIHEALCKDFRLTALDWRVIVYLLNRSEDWRVSQADVANEVLSNERDVRRSLIRLEELGYGHRVMSKGKTQPYMIDFVLNYISPSIPSNRTQTSGSTGHTAPVKRSSTGHAAPVQPDIGGLQPDIGGSEPDIEDRFNRTQMSAPTGHGCPTTELELNQRPNKTTEPKSEIPDSEKMKENSDEGCEAQRRFLEANFLTRRSNVSNLPPRPFRPSIIQRQVGAA